MSLVHLLVRAAVALATAALLLALVTALAALVAPRLAGLEPTIVLSGSMTPVLRPGGLAFVRALDTRSTIEGASTSDPTAAVRKGDIITFRAPRSPEQRVSHRVIGVINDRDGRRFATQGDANSRPDPVLVPAENVVGTVVYHVPYLGYFANWLRQRNAFLVLVGTPAALVVLSESRTIVRDVREHRRPSRAELHRLLRDLARA